MRKLGPRDADLLPSPDDVREARGGPEVLLLQPELLSLVEILVWVEDAGDGLCLLGLADRAVVVAGVEGPEVEPPVRLRPPEADIVGVDRLVPWDGNVVRHSEHLDASGPAVLGSSVPVGLAVEADSDSVVESRDLPRVSAGKVRVGNLDLLAILVDTLHEDTVLVAKTVSPVSAH